MPFEAFIVAALQYKEPAIQSSYGDFWLLVPDFFFKGKFGTCDLDKLGTKLG